MATFKVGQRVRWIKSSSWYSDEVPLGTTGTIAEPFGLQTGDEVCVHSDGRGDRYAQPWQLAPLTDPGADAFLESIRKLKPLHEEPKVEKHGNRLVTLDEVLRDL